jgi:hypothetical protein
VHRASYCAELPLNIHSSVRSLCAPAVQRKLPLPGVRAFTTKGSSTKLRSRRCQSSIASAVAMHLHQAFCLAS